MRHRTIALLALAVITAFVLGPQAAERAGYGDWGGAVGSMLAPFLYFVLANLVVYVLARLVLQGRVAGWRETRLNYVGLAVAGLALLGLAVRG